MASTTASTPSLSPSPPPQSTNDDIDKSGITALVSWDLADGTTDYLQAIRGGSSSTLCHPKLQLRYECASRTALFKLQLSVLLKPRRNKAKNTAQFFVLIPPESIDTLSAARGEDLPETVRKSSSVDTICLRFTLRTPPTVVCPPAPSRLVPKNEHGAGVLASLQELARQTNIAIYLPHRALDQSRLQTLCTAVSNCGLTSGDPNSTATLYGGQGGRPLDASIIAACEDVGVFDAAGLPAADSPPSYDELGPGPPPGPTPAVLPAAAGSRKRPRRSSSGDGSRPPSPSCGGGGKVLKNRDVQATWESSSHVDGSGKQVVQAGHPEKTEVAELLERQMERMEQRLTARLDRFEQLITEQLEEHKRSITEMVEERMDLHEEQTQTVLDYLRREVESDVEDQLISKKAELEEQFKDEREVIQASLEERFADLEESITARFSSARAYLEFD